MNRVDSTIRIAAGVTVVGLAGIAGAISYSHMTHLAHLHGETGWRGHMFPLSVDGIEIVASLVLFADKHARRRSGGLPWAALISGTGASFAANMAVGGSDWIGRAVSGWPAFALLVAVKLLFGLLEHPIAPNAGGDAVRFASSAVRDGTGTVPVGRDEESDGDRDPSVSVSSYSAFGDHDSVVSPAGGVSQLLPAVRAARDTLARKGESLTRDALASQMRADGHAASNARISTLLKTLAADQATPAGGPEVA